MKVFAVLLIGAFYSATAHIDSKELRCLVCQKTLEELDIEIQKIDPTLKTEVGGYRLDGQGNLQKKTVLQAKSELHISELADKVCERLDDYVRATWKSNGQLTILRLLSPTGGMNPDLGEVDIVQDDDLNKSLKYHCEGIIAEYEENIIEHYQKNLDNIDIRVCSLEAKLCTHSLPEPDERISDEL